MKSLFAALLVCLSFSGAAFADDANCAVPCSPECCQTSSPDQCFSPCEPGQELYPQVSCCCGNNGCNGCSGDCCGDGCCCGNRYCNCWDCSDGCGKHHCLCHLLGLRESTCDMVQHYPYYPVNHGYYYFRPYNWSHIGLHKELAMRVGTSPASPYASSSILEPIYRELESGYDAPTYEAPRLRRFSESLPDLQDILDDSQS